MTSTRRDFIKGVGIALASYLLARCTPPNPTPGSGGQPTPIPPTATSAGGGESTRERLRDLWLQFERLAQETLERQDEPDMGEELRQEMVAEHRTLLQQLVDDGELEQAVADYAQQAYSAAAYHVWRCNAPITCYEPVLIDFTPTTSAQLVRQADLLAEIADQGNLDPETVAQAQRAIERDIAFLALPGSEVQELYDKLIEAAGDSRDYPSFDEIELGIPPEAAEAARFLVELLLEE